jgi:hypothetical protein
MSIDNVEGPAAGTAAAGKARHVEMISVEGLAPYAGNPRTHSKKQIRQLAKSIERFGFTNPILLDDRGQIIAFPQGKVSRSGRAAFLAMFSNAGLAQ